MLPTILIADDDEDDVFLLRDVLKTTNLINPIQIAQTGEEVIQYLSGNGRFADREKYPFPTLLFLDLNMPRKSGLEVMEWICANEAKNKLGVVMLTGMNNSAEMRRAYELGVLSFLIKPLQFDDIKDLVKYSDSLQLRNSDDGFILHFSRQGFGLAA